MMDAELLARNITAHWLQAGVLATSALIAIRLLSLDEPRARLAALHMTIVAIVLLPLVQPRKSVEPALEVTSTAIVTSAGPSGSVEAAPGGIGAASVPDPSVALAATVIAGTGMRLLWLLAGIIRLRRFSRTASSVAPPSVAGDLEAELGVSARYIQQTGSRGPWTFGWIRPAVALPAGFDSLAPAFQRAVICHELLHIKRRDIAIAFFEELAVALLWFHPWMWLLHVRIRVAREQAVDARVVSLLGNRDEYVRCLVDMSGHDLAPHFSQAGAGMLRPRELRARVDAIFQEVRMSRARFAVAALSFVAVTAATGLIAITAMPLRASSLVPAATSNEPIPLLVSRFLIAEGSATAISWTAAAQPQAARSQAAPDAPRKQVNMVYPEYPQDALERGIKGTVIVDITVNAAGDVTTAAVASGPQELRASAFKAALQLKYTQGSSTTAMKIAFDYLLTGTSWGVKINGGALPNIGLRPLMTQNRETPTDERNANLDATGAYRVGGALQPPKKLKDVPPVYPPLAQEARVQGVVIIEARIDESGNISDTRVLRSIPLLDEAATDAVKQWQYTPTLMNGVAVPVLMTTTVNFTLRPLARIQVTMPDGSAATELRADVPTQFVADFGRFHLTPSRSEGSPDLKVSVFDEDGQTHLGDVLLLQNGPVVQSPTTPSFGMRLVVVR